MSTLDAKQPEETHPPPYPTYEALIEQGRHGTRMPVRLSPPAQRLFWRLSGPLPTSLSTMSRPHDPDSLEPYFQPSTSTGTWHAISQCPLTEPPVSSIAVGVYELEMWEEQWLEMHREHSSAAEEGGEEEGGEEESAEGVRWGELPDYDEEEDEEGEGDGAAGGHLLTCCGEERPRGKAVSVMVEAAASHGFVTVHDYVSTVHPWLMSMREDILAAIRMHEGVVCDVNGVSVPIAPSSGADLMVNYDAPARLMMCNKPIWIKQTRNPPQLDVTAIPVSGMQRGSGLLGI
jgi:hypothetical protein